MNVQLKLEETIQMIEAGEMTAQELDTILQSADFGVDDPVNEMQENLLFVTLKKQRADLLDVLIKHNTDLNQKYPTSEEQFKKYGGTQGVTALSEALPGAFEGGDLIEKMLQAGANPRQNSEMGAEFLEGGFPSEDEFCLLLGTFGTVLGYVIELEGNHNLSDAEKKCQKAEIEDRGIDICRLLIEYGASMEMAYDDGKTLESLAREVEMHKLADFFQKAEADKKARYLKENLQIASKGGNSTKPKRRPQPKM